jgi:hypothetical protein
MTLECYRLQVLRHRKLCRPSWVTLLFLLTGLAWFPNPYLPENIEAPLGFSAVTLTHSALLSYFAACTYLTSAWFA